MVSAAVYAAQPDGIARVDTTMDGLDPAGLEIMTTDGAVYQFRAFCVSGRGQTQEAGHLMPGGRYSRRSI